MDAASVESALSIRARFHANFRSFFVKSELGKFNFRPVCKFSRNILYSPVISSPKEHVGPLRALHDDDHDAKWEESSTPILDMVENPIHLKNLSIKELEQLAKDIRLELSQMAPKMLSPLKAALDAVELAIAVHYVFHAPMDKVLWDAGKQTYAHKLLTGRRLVTDKMCENNALSGYTSRSESEYDAFGAAHGCNSISAGLGMAVARDIKGRKERVVTIISNESTMAGQVYEAMSSAGYLDSNLVVILNDTRHSLHPKPEEGPRTPVNALSSALSKIQTSKYFQQFRNLAKGLTKKIGRGTHEWAAKLDAYIRGMIGAKGSTLFEELGLYYIGPVDGNNLEDLICVLQGIASLDSMGPVLVHVLTNEKVAAVDNPKSEVSEKISEGCCHADSFPSGIGPQTYSDCFVAALSAQAEKDKDIVVVHAGMGMDFSLQLFQETFPDRFFDVGMAEQHAVTFSAGLACGGLKPFCIIPSTFLQRAYDQVVHDVDRQKLPVRFAITGAGLVGSQGPVLAGPFDVNFMSCLPNMVVMAPSDEIELTRMVITAAEIDDRPVCFRFPGGAVSGTINFMDNVMPLEVGKGRILAKGKDIAFLGYGAMVQNCISARSILAELGVEVTIADARFCKPLDIDLLRYLCRNHSFLVTVEEGSIGGFGSHVAQFMALDGKLDGRIKWRPMVLPDTYIERGSLKEQMTVAGLTGNHIAATALSLLGRTRDALLLMR